ncbi:MAG TPA: hypothetical protein VGB91_01220 [Rhizomicrobium sp.]
MPTLVRFANFEIVMYFEDRNPPHVHGVGREFEMLVASRDGTVLAGAASADHAARTGPAKKSTWTD